jgi:hypothetical protein
VDLKLNTSKAVSRRGMLKLGAAAGVAAGGAALGLAPNVAAASATGLLPGPGPSVTAPRIPTVPVVNNAISKVVAISDLTAMNGLLTLVSGTSNAYCSPLGPGSGNPFVLAAINVPPGATLVAVSPVGTSTAGQTWDVVAEDLFTGGLFVPAGFHGVTTAGSLQFVNMSGSYTVPLYTRLNLQCLPSGDVANSVAGATYFYIPPTPGFHPIAPVRVYDSRLTGGPISGGETRTVSVATSTGGAPAVPSAASAILFNLTITGTGGAGYLALFPFGTSWPGNSSINWNGGGLTLANGGDVILGGDRQVSVYAGAGGAGVTQFIIDVTGYYL